jgi:hypothetical protein
MNPIIMGLIVLLAVLALAGLTFLFEGVRDLFGFTRACWGDRDRDPDEIERRGG